MTVRTVRIIGYSGADSSAVTATADDVLDGKIFIDKDGLETVGTIPVYRGGGTESNTVILDVGDHYNVPRGYYEEGAVTIINEKLDFLNGTATQEEVLEGYTIPIGNDLKEGSIPIRSANDTLLASGESLLIDPGYYTTEFTVSCADLSTQTIGNALAENLLKDKTAYVNGNLIVGTMPIAENKITNLNAGDSFDIVKGYHDGTGRVIANSLASQTPGTAQANQIISGATAWVNGSKVTGNVIDRGTVNQALNCGGSYTIPAGFHSGSGKVTANSLSSQTSATAVAGNILTGKTAWVNGSKLTGTMPNKGAPTAALNCGGTYNIVAGYYSGGKVTANSLSSQTSATAVAGDILIGKTAYVNGSKLTGTMGTHAGSTYKSTTANQTISCSGKKMTSNIIIQGDSNLKAENIKKGISILGVAGSLIGGGTITDLLSIQGYKDKMVGDYTYYTIAFNYSTTKNIVAVWYYYNSRTAFDWGIAYNIQSNGRCYIQTCRQNKPMTFDNVYNSIFSVHKNGATLCCTFDGASTYYGYLLLSD